MTGDFAGVETEPEKTRARGMVSRSDMGLLGVGGGFCGVVCITLEV